MHVLITGAQGFVGAALARRLAASGHLGPRALSRLSLVDLDFGTAPRVEGMVHRLAGDLADTAWLDAALQGPALDAVFHLASIPGGTAEAQYELARRVNLDATLALLERGRAQVLAGGPAPRFVFASSIAVYGVLPEQVDDTTPARPAMTYGAQKLAAEVLLDDFSRRRWVDGVSLRLPGVLARPPVRTGQLSAFLSDMLRELCAGRPFVCPMSPQATTWASSLPNVLDNLLHAAQMDLPAQPGARRSFTLPTMRYSMAELAAAIATLHGPAAVRQLRYAPDAQLEARFGRFPPLQTAAAEAAGFRADASLVELVQRSLQAG